MRHKLYPRTLGLLVLFAVYPVTYSLAIEADLATRYTWMLPKTILDTTISYSFQECAIDATKNLAIAKFKITPTLSARPAPDLRVGQKSLPVEQFQTFLKDEGVSLETYAGSHILSSIGSQPSDQTGTVIGNVLGGITKIVAIAAGVPPVPAAPGAAGPEAPQITCKSENGSASQISSQIKGLRASITDFEKQLASGVDETTQKKLTGAIQAAQSLVTELQGKLSITLKTTIDPGISPVDVDPQNDTTEFMVRDGDGKVANSGLIARICPSKNQLNELNVFSGLPDDKSPCAVFPQLGVNVYLDFPSGHSTMYGPGHPGLYEQTDVLETQLYRDPAYIPVLVWRGERLTGQPKREGGEITGDVLLMPPVTVAFGQFGVAQTLPLQPDAFQQLNWLITFLEDGQVTKAAYSSKATGVGLTGLFGNGSSAASSIATEFRNSTNQSAETEATKLQGQADQIYQTHRLETCYANPSTCAAK